MIPPRKNDVVIFPKRGMDHGAFSGRSCFYGRINRGHCLYLFVYLMFTVVIYRDCRNLALIRIKDIGIIHRSRYYPKHYITPKRWMRKLFDIKQRIIPRFLYFELFVSLFYVILGPLNIVITIAVGVDTNIAGILFMSYLGLIMVNVICNCIISHRFKRK